MDRDLSECPYLDQPLLGREDPTCADRCQMGRLEEFFAICCGNYRRCQTYHRLRAEEARAAAPGSDPTVALTAHGRELRVRAYLP